MKDISQPEQACRLLQSHNQPCRVTLRSQKCFHNSSSQVQFVRLVSLYRVHTRSLCSQNSNKNGGNSEKKSQTIPGEKTKNEFKSESKNQEERYEERDEPPEVVSIVQTSSKLAKAFKAARASVGISSAKEASKKEATEIQKDEVLKPYKQRRRKVNYVKYTDNNTITALRAMNDYLLKSSDLEHLRKTARRSPYDRDPREPPLMVYLRSDIEHKAIEIWGSKEALERERKKRKEKDDALKENLFLLKSSIREFDIFGEQKAHQAKSQRSIFTTGSGKVVLSAIAINTANLIFKSVAWLYSGSASMFSEAVHSAADVCNQVILAFGIQQSIRRPSKVHPYGFASVQYVSSLISGVAIFCVGAGLSYYHGIMGLINPEPIGSLFWSYCILGGSVLSEGATLVIAINAIRGGARKQGMQFWEYVWRSRDPSVNVVFMEDLAAVLGVTAAACCMGLTSLTGNPLYDSMGSIAVGTILASVSGFLIYTNTDALVGRSIPEYDLAKIREVLENDVMVRGIYDVKATDMGVNQIRFKSEIDFDGAEVTRSYLDRIDIEALLKEVKSLGTLEEFEAFMLLHGERIIDALGAEVDRIEKEIKKANPEVRHVDLEIL
ncbi:putative zinc transporter 9 [Apostichopus japonicus]|uniref:Proton-coupled zinc antiporter SLC30A9, mitochondrial n=1 Tax=Stichopus japonicus TaxID=307972 RepID=A0A2G8KLF0_STIJA|nr:putative zinc transporter 9 [Apostichopus japonicus]